MSNNVIIDIWSGINEGGWKINNNYDIGIERQTSVVDVWSLFSQSRILIFQLD